jgi:hypothetical protein
MQPALPRWQLLPPLNQFLVLLVWLPRASPARNPPIKKLNPRLPLKVLRKRKRRRLYLYKTPPPLVRKRT